MSIADDPDFPKLIKAYRTNILVKYGEINLKNYPEFNRLSQEKIHTMTRYFMELLYPEWGERQKLDSAFLSLKGFVQKPSKVFGLIGSLGISLWKIGRFLPEAFRAGIAALSSYLTAHDMEADLLIEAKKFISRGEDINQELIFQKMLTVIPRNDAEKFRKDTVALFRTLTHNELVDRIILIMDNIIVKMKSNTKLYSKEDIDGISLGLSILKQGREILSTLDQEEKDLMLEAIDRIEKDYYEACFSIYP
jgi:hypothetical protein